MTLMAGTKFHNSCCCLVTQLCLTLCDPMDCSKPGFPVLHHLPELAQTHVHWVSNAIHISSSVIPFSSCPQSLPASGSFLMSRLFASGGQSIASVLPMNIQEWLLGHPYFREICSFFWPSSALLDATDTSLHLFSVTPLSSVITRKASSRDLPFLKNSVLLECF